MDLGQNGRGVDMGPSALRYASLQEKLTRLGYQTFDGGNLSVPQIEEVENAPSLMAMAVKFIIYREVAAICQTVYEKAAHSLDEEERVIFLGGDHSVSIGTVAAVAP